MKKCIRCGEKEIMCKKMCGACYYATRRGGKIRKEILLERNYVENGVGILTDKKGNRWEIDLEDFAKCSKEFWTDNGVGYAKSQKVGYLHKFICPKWKIVDHKDRNRRNNKRENLRDGTGVNWLNKTLKLPCSGYRGIHKARDRWEVRISRKRKRVYLGTFDTIADARLVLINWAKKNNLSEFYT